MSKIDDIADRAGELANKKMDELRLICGYGCETESDARCRNRYKTRGEMIAEILAEEFNDE